MWSALLIALFLPLTIEAGTFTFVPAMGGGDLGDQPVDRVYTWMDWETFGVSGDDRASNAEGVCMATEVQFSNYFNLQTTGESIGYPWFLLDYSWSAGTPDGWLWAGCDDMESGGDGGGTGVYEEWNEDALTAGGGPDGLGYSQQFIAHMKPTGLTWVMNQYACMRMRGLDIGNTPTFGHTQAGGGPSEVDVVFRAGYRDLEAEVLDGDTVTLNVGANAAGTLEAADDAMYSPNAITSPMAIGAGPWQELDSLTDWPTALGYPDDIFGMQFVCMATVEVEVD